MLLSQKKILLVEDDELLRRMYEKGLMLEGAAVVSAGDGGEAIEKLVSEKVDAVLLDLMMPKVNGYETIRRMKANPETAHIPIVVLTNVDAHPEYIEKFSGSKVEAYLVKANTSVNQVIGTIAKFIPQ